MGELVGSVYFASGATHHDVSHIARVIEEQGYEVDHLVNPKEDEPHLNIEKPQEADDA